MLVSSPASGHVEIDQILDSMSTSVEPSLENATPVLNLRDHPDIIQPLSHLPHSTPPIMRRSTMPFHCPANCIVDVGGSVSQLLLRLA
jgi:hypothetical protein